VGRESLSRLRIGPGERRSLPEKEGRAAENNRAITQTEEFPLTWGGSGVTFCSQEAVFLKGVNGR